MTSLITPRVDLAFKKLFGVEENKDLLIALINAIVSEEDQISEVTLLNPYNPQNFKNDKLTILDIKAKGQTGKRYNIEIQISDEADYDKRALYYWAKLYTEQLQRADDYAQLNKAIGIHILNFTSILDSKKYHNAFHITEKETQLPYFKDLELHTIELNKFEAQLPPAEEGTLDQLLPLVKTSLDRWAAFLTRHDLLSKHRVPESLKDPHLKKALDVLEVMNFSAQEREFYEDHLKWLRIEANTLKKMRDEGEAIGLKRGGAEGLVEGEKKGLEKGAKAKALEIAKGMLAQGLDAKMTARLTGLSLEEVEKLLS